MDFGLLHGLLVLLAGIALVILLAGLLQRRGKRDSIGPRLGGSYESELVLCDQRKAMLWTLQQAFPGHTVLPMVPAILLVSPRGGSKLAQRREALRRQILDYVVLDAEGKAVFVFKLNSNNSSTRKADEAFVTWALKQAGITTYRISGLRSKISAQRLRAAVGWEAEGPDARPEYRTMPLRGPLVLPEMPVLQPAGH